MAVKWERKKKKERKEKEKQRPIWFVNQSIWKLYFEGEKTKHTHIGINVA